MSYDKKAYEMAENEINNRRLRAKAELQRRQDEIYAKIPEIKEIDEQLSMTSVEITKLIIQKKVNFEKSFNDIKERNLQAQEMMQELLTAGGYPTDYLDTPYTCKICNDWGFVDGERCSCYKRLLNKYEIKKLNASANMPDADFEHFSLSYYKDIINDDGTSCYDIMSRIFDSCKNYAERFSLNSQSLFFSGGTGLGKTHLSIAIAKRVAQNGFNVAYGSFLNYLSIIEKEHFGRADSSSDTMNVLINADLLVLDDLGAEFSTPFYEMVTYNIINSRINLSLPTIISTNLSPEEMDKRYKDHIISRIFGTYNTFCFVGEDIRSIKRIGR